MCFSITTAIAAPTCKFSSHCEVLTLSEQPFPVLACSRGLSACNGFDLIYFRLEQFLTPCQRQLSLPAASFSFCLSAPCHLGLLTANNPGLPGTLKPRITKKPLAWILALRKTS